MKKYDIAIIGGGILGTTISYWISNLYDSSVCVIEKESNVAKHTSGRNTGVVHTPFYLNPEKKKIFAKSAHVSHDLWKTCLLYTSPSPRDATLSRMPSSA